MFELHLRCPAEAVDLVSDALEALDALSVSVEDADAQTPAEQALFGEPGMPPPQSGWQRSRVVALFPSQEAAQEAARLLALQDFATAIEGLGIEAVPDEDWVRLTQAQFALVEIAPAFWIVPSWHALPEGARQVIRLDPGLAFGTGTHPTTRMCLRWIAQNAGTVGTASGRVLDYGCGSGILAIGAAKFGARDIDAVDIDPTAVEQTMRNAEANDVALSVVGLPDAVRGTYQTVLANILATPLKVLAPLLAAHVAPGGRLVLAGILARQAEELKAAYAPWLPIEVADEEAGWVLMTGARGPAHT